MEKTDVEKILEAIKRSEIRIEDRIARMEARIENRLSDIENDIRKIAQWVPIENSDLIPER